MTAFGTYQHVVFEHKVNAEVQEVLDDGEYSTLELTDVATEYNDGSVFSEEVSVTVTVDRTSDLEYEGLAEDLQDEISAETGRSVEVDVQFVDYQRAPAVGDGERSWWGWEWLSFSVEASLAQSVPETVALPAELVDQRAHAA